jgi:hypothetical protein
MYAFPPQVCWEIFDFNLSDALLFNKVSIQTMCCEFPFVGVEYWIPSIQI